jgi:hypothetical protein
MFPFTDNSEQLLQDKTVYPELFSKWAILLATIIGSPIAGGILIYKNYKNLHQPQKALSSLICCIVLTVICIATALLLPEHVLVKIPIVIFPLIYTTVVYFLIDGSLNHFLAEHERNGRLFYPLWKAISTGVACLIVIIIFYIAFFSFSPDQYKHPAYVSAMQEFNQNENEALELFDMLSYAGPEAASAFIREKGIPAWRENIALLTRLSYVGDLHPDVKYQVNRYIMYCNLRIRYYELVDKALTENTDKYDEELQNLGSEINKYLNPPGRPAQIFD